MRSICGWLLILIPIPAFCQAPGSELYQYNYMTVNSAFAGTDGMKLTALGQVLNFKERYNTKYKTHSSFVGFEMPLDKINCGTGVNATIYDNAFDKGLIINVPFNYQFDFDDTRKLSFGVNAGYSSMRVPEISKGPRPMDSRGYWRTLWAPFVDGHLMTRSGFTAGLGVAYRGPNFYAGFSVDNVLKSPDLDLFDDNNPDESYELVIPQYHSFIGCTFKWGRRVSTDHSLYVLSYNSGDPLNHHDPVVDINNSVVLFKTAIVGFTMGSLDDKLVPKINAGVQLKNFGKLVVMVYSKTKDFPGKELSGQVFLQVNVHSSNEPS